MSRLHQHAESHLVARIGWLRAAALGANDGIVSTTSLIVGVAGAAAKRGDVLIAGIAGRVAGKWLWKDAYDAVEAAQLLFLRRYLRPCAKRAAG